MGRWLIHTADSVDSTQKWVRERLLDLKDRSVILACSQTQGRGRMGRSWQSPPGGFYTSILMKPPPPLEGASRLSLLAALILSRIMNSDGIPAMVKWPNDVIAGGRKIAGILAEAGTNPVAWYILGIGVNLRSEPPLDHRRRLPAGCWSGFSEPPHPEELLSRFLHILDEVWPEKDEDPLSGRLTSINSVLWGKGVYMAVRSGSDLFSGVVERVAADGSLVLRTDSGERRFVAGELLTVHEESAEK
jgi:BirA family transcriptional regulator, biotin operon repressor / biotin---[acetyl-CoA-carboxylase] ligase